MGFPITLHEYIETGNLDPKKKIIIADLLKNFCPGGIHKKRTFEDWEKELKKIMESPA